MKLADIVKIIANELGTSDLKEINKLLKAKPAIKFRITGKALKNLGFTGQIKSLSEEGIKAFMTNKVSLIRLHEIETFEKRSTSEWYVKSLPPKPTAGTVSAKTSENRKSTKVMQNDDAEVEDFEEDDDFDEAELPSKKPKKGKEKATGKQGSKFIPSPRKK